MKPIQSQTLRQIDQALEFLLTNRLAHFRNAREHYSAHRDTQHIGFEAMVSAELYTRLQHGFDDNSVFLEYPGIEKKRIDLYLNYCDRGKWF